MKIFRWWQAFARAAVLNFNYLKFSFLTEAELQLCLNFARIHPERSQLQCWVSGVRFVHHPKFGRLLDKFVKLYYVPRVLCIRTIKI